MGGTSSPPLDDIVQEEDHDYYFTNKANDSTSSSATTSLLRSYCTCGLVFELLQCFEFIKLAYKYYCAAKDEMIFLVLDVHVQNVARTYLLKHKGIDGLFDSIFNWLNAILMEENDNDQNDGISLNRFKSLCFVLAPFKPSFQSTCSDLDAKINPTFF
ncbi:hypothetical protein TorRG33x02_349560 [Trema orientale]|uniref:Uncharacterized protein n=1 Tax=Trema orientale TaxID=63057 RepID=A0A2P5AIF8_TREOI|nr:hypothetical protein TorRG33x02_349560 [Trema orientale]